MRAAADWAPPQQSGAICFKHTLTNTRAHTLTLGHNDEGNFTDGGESPIRRLAAIHFLMKGSFIVTVCMFFS